MIEKYKEELIKKGFKVVGVDGTGLGTGFTLMNKELEVVVLKEPLLDDEEIEQYLGGGEEVEEKIMIKMFGKSVVSKSDKQKVSEEINNSGKIYNEVLKQIWSDLK